MPCAMLICGLGGLEKPALVASGDKEAAQIELTYPCFLFSLAVIIRERTVYQGCNSRGVFS